MNTFEKHGVMNLSPSTINLWIEQPALCLLKIAGINDGEAGPAAWRGTAADRALGAVAQNPDMTDKDAIIHALQVYNDQQQAAIDPHRDEKIEQERADVERYVTSGAKFYRSLQEPLESTQGKVTVKLDGASVPYIGYYDLLYADTVRDTKTTGRMVSKLTQAHCRQASIYALAMGREPWIDYVGKKEVRAFKVENVPYWVRQVELATQSLERVLSFSDNTLECCQLVYPDLDHWKWGETTRQAAKDIWKMEG